MRTLVIICLLSVSFPLAPLWATGKGPNPNPTGPGPGQKAKTKKTATRWWVKKASPWAATEGILPERDTSMRVIQTPISYAEARDPGDEPGTYVFDETPAELLNLKEAMEVLEYPEALRRVGIEGRVVIRMEVDYTGTVRRYDIIRSTHSMMTEASRAIIPQLKFIPARQAGRQVGAVVTLPIRFELKKTAKK